jgi:hypothetical protein
MLRLTLDLSGKDATFISNSYRYHTGLCTLTLYRNHPDALPSTELLKQHIDTLQLAFEGGSSGSHAEIVKRKKARKDLSEIFKKILSYLQSIATEEDLPELVQAGFGIRRAATRKKAAPQPAS